MSVQPRVSLGEWWWAPAPETPEEARWAARSLGQRLGAALVATLLVAVVVSAVYAAGSGIEISSGWSRGEASALRGLVMEIPLAIVVSWLGWKLVGSRAALGLQLRGAGASLVFSVPMFLLAVSERRLGELPRFEHVLFVFVLSAVVGCVEEVYGRGLLVTLLGGRRHSILAVLGSALPFAYLHLPTYWQIDGFRDAMLRCASSAAFSAVFALIRLRSGSLIGPVVFHAIDDALYMFRSRSDTSAIHATFSIRPFFVGCVFAFAYWLVCRNAITRSARAIAVPAAAEARGA